MGVHLGQDGPQASFEVLSPGGGIDGEGVLIVRAGEGKDQPTKEFTLVG